MLKNTGSVEILWTTFDLRWYGLLLYRISIWDSTWFYLLQFLISMSSWLTVIQTIRESLRGVNLLTNYTQTDVCQIPHRICTLYAEKFDQLYWDADGRLPNHAATLSSSKDGHLMSRWEIQVALHFFKMNKLVNWMWALLQKVWMRLHEFGGNMYYECGRTRLRLWYTNMAIHTFADSADLSSHVS